MEILAIGLAVFSLSAAFVVCAACALSSRITHVVSEETPSKEPTVPKPVFARKHA